MFPGFPEDVTLLRSLFLSRVPLLRWVLAALSSEHGETDRRGSGLHRQEPHSILMVTFISI